MPGWFCVYKCEVCVCVCVAESYFFRHFTQAFFQCDLPKPYDVPCSATSPSACHGGSDFLPWFLNTHSQGQRSVFNICKWINSAEMFWYQEIMLRWNSALWCFILCPFYVFTLEYFVSSVTHTSFCKQYMDTYNWCLHLWNIKIIPFSEGKNTSVKQSLKRWPVWSMGSAKEGLGML